MKKGNSTVVARTTIMLTLAAILTISVLSNNSFTTIIPASAGEKDHKDKKSDQIPTVVTIPLEGLSLDPFSPPDSTQFLLLSDITPVRVDAAHIAINVPCENEESDIVVVAGVAPNVQPVELEFVGPLSSEPDNCTFHGDIPNNSDEVTDIAILNAGEETIQFGSGNFATLAITEVSN
jgi:hypothetical protein